VDAFLSAGRHVALLAAITCIFTLVAACHPGPIANAGAKPVVGGTIAGTVRADGGSASLAGRKVTVINQDTGARLETTTATNGGYTIQVPAGTYRIDVELHEGETLATRPEPTKVGVGDLDADRNFILTIRR
jgi:hypothetical protein